MEHHRAEMNLFSPIFLSHFFIFFPIPLTNFLQCSAAERNEGQFFTLINSDIDFS